MIRRLFLGVLCITAICLAQTAFCQTSCSLPYNLQNGTVADANQVMANFNAQQTCLQAASPTLPTNAALAAALTINYPNGVWRTDYAAGVGAPPQWFLPESGTCTSNSRINDGGSCVNTTSGDGNSFYAVFPAVFDVRQWGAKGDGGATDSAAAINLALVYAEAVGGSVDLGGKTYGVCAAPVLVATPTATAWVRLQNGGLVLTGGCGSGIDSVLHNTANTNVYNVGASFRDLVVNGACTTKYVYKVDGGAHSTHQNVQIQNPATNAAISGSAGIYLNGGTEFKFGTSNWITAEGTCYNTGNLPTYGINHVAEGNADFTGVVVVNFITGLQLAGDDFAGTGTHVWGGCHLTGTSCSFDAALRTTNGIILNGSGGVMGVEIDDPINAGVVLNHVDSLDRMTAIGTDCVFTGTPGSSQTCVSVTTGTVGSLVEGTVAPQLANANFSNNIVFVQAAIGQSVTITNNPQASIYGGEAQVIAMAATLPGSPNGCVAQTGYIAGAGNCGGLGWVTSPTTGCRIKSLYVALAVAPGVGNTTTFTVQDNGSDTPLTGFISGSGSFDFTNNTGVWDVGPTHVLSLHVSTTAGTPAGSQMRAALYGCG